MKSRESPEALITRKPPVSVMGEVYVERKCQGIKGWMSCNTAHLEMQTHGSQPRDSEAIDLKWGPSRNFHFFF